MQGAGGSGMIFLVSALVGPLLRAVTWPPSLTPAQNFIYDLVLLIWPAQPFAAMESSIGRIMALGYAVAANVVLFGIVGVLAGLFCRQPVWLFAIYAFALAVAFLLYAVPFFLVYRFYRPARLTPADMA
jgi:hypothetical protein